MDKMMRHLLWTFLAFALGIVIGRVTMPVFGAYLLILAILFFVAAILWLWKKEWFLCILPLVLIAGIFYCDFRESTPLYQVEAKTAVEVTGMVSSYPRQGENSTVFFLETETVNGEEIAVTLRIVAPVGSEFSYGDMLEIEGDVLESSAVQNPGQFDYESYQREQGISGTLSALYGGKIMSLEENRGNALLKAAFFCRAKFEAALAYLPDRQGDLVRGIFLGDKSGLSFDDKNILSESGVMHAFAVSGLHVGYIILLFSAFFQVLGIRRWRAFVLLLPILFVYAAITGFVPSVLRAALMALMLLIGKNLGRDRDGYTALAAAGLFLLLLDPGNLFKVSFQLSFLAMLSILYFSPFFRRLLQWQFPLKESVILLLAAQIGLIPMLAYYFNIVSFVSFFINTLACFLVGFVVILSVFALPLSLFSAVLGALPLYGAGLIAEITWFLVAWAASLPFAYRYIKAITLWQMSFAYFGLFLLPWLPPLKKRVFATFGAMVLLLILVFFPWPGGEGKLTVTFLSVGEGDAIHIQTPEGENILLDAGGGDPEEAANLILLPYFKSMGITTIDLFINSHAHADHLDGIYTLFDHMEVAEVVVAEAGLSYSGALLAAAEENGSPVTTVAAGDVLELDGETSIEVLYPPALCSGSENDVCLVVKVSYGETSFLLTSDMEMEAIETLLADGTDLEADVLKIPHHGSKYSYQPEFYQEVDPDAVVISVGTNSYGHPGTAVLSFWEESGIPLFRTDEDGAIMFISDGETIDVRQFQ